MTRTATKSKTERYEMTDDLQDNALVPLADRDREDYITELEGMIASLQWPTDPVDLADDIFARLTPLQRERFRLRFAAQTRATDESTVRQRAYKAVGK